MAGEDWREGILYDEDGEYELARIRYRLEQGVEMDGFPCLNGQFVVREESCPLHTGMAQLRFPEGKEWLVRVLRLSRPRGDGEFEVVDPLPGVHGISIGT